MERSLLKNSLERYQYTYLEKVIVESPDFQPYWDRAYDTWKDYIIKKEETKN